MKRLLFILVFSFYFLFSFSQFIDFGAKKIYSGRTAGTNIIFKLESDSTYDIKVISFWCSFCDFNELAKDINQHGHWELQSDKIILFPTDTLTTFEFRVISDRTLKPLFPLDRNILKMENDSIRNKLINRIQSSDIFDFSLIYETFGNGIVKESIYTIGNSKNEYRIHYSKTGEIQRIEKYRNGKWKEDLQ